MLYLLIGYMWLFVHRPFEVWPILATLRLERIYMLLTILLWTLSQPKKFTPNPLNLALAYFGTTIAASAILSPFSPGIDPTTEDWLKAGVFYIIFVTSIRDDRQLSIMALAYCAIVTLYAAHSYREFLCGRHFFRMGIVRMIGVDRTYNDPNTFAATLVYSLPLFRVAWGLACKRWHKILVLASVGLLAWCVSLTGSRSGLVGLAAAGLFHIPRQRRLLALAAIAFVGGILWFAAGERLQRRYLSLYDPSITDWRGHTSAEARKEGFYGGLRVFWRYPLLGCGPGRFAETGVTFVQAHNLYGQVLGELGLGGTSAFAGLIAAFVSNNTRTRRLARASTRAMSSTAFAVNRAVMRTVALLLLMGWGGHNLYRYTWVWFAAFQVVAARTVDALAVSPKEF